VEGRLRFVPEALLLARVCCLISFLLFVPTPAFADHGPVTVDGDYHNGTVTTVIEASGSNDAASGPTVDVSSPSGGVHCEWVENSTQLEDGYLDLGWGVSGGHWYDVKCSDGNVYLSIFVPPAANNIPPQVALTTSLAQRAVNQLQLPVPDVHVNPSGDALVGLAEWFWTDPAQWRSLSQRTQAGPVWARVTATPMSTTWNPGNGSPPVTCSGPGTPYDRSVSASSQRSDCTFTYTRSSAEQPQVGAGANDRFFTVTVTTTWSVSWVGSGGAGGTLPAMSRSRSFPLRVEERQAVVTGGSG